MAIKPTTTEVSFHRVVKYDASGTYVTHWGESGTGIGQFREPTRIKYDNGLIYVLDSGNKRIQCFTTNGGFVGKTGAFNELWDFTFTASRVIASCAYAGSGNSTLRHFNKQTLTGITSYPVTGVMARGLAYDRPSDCLFVAQGLTSFPHYSAQVTRISTTGSLMGGAGYDGNQPRLSVVCRPHGGLVDVIWDTEVYSSPSLVYNALGRTRTAGATPGLFDTILSRRSHITMDAYGPTHYFDTSGMTLNEAQDALAFVDDLYASGSSLGGYLWSVVDAGTGALRYLETEDRYGSIVPTLTWSGSRWVVTYPWENHVDIGGACVDDSGNMYITDRNTIRTVSDGGMPPPSDEALSQVRATLWQHPRYVV